MTKQCLMIATRESPLALKQAESIKALLEILYPDLTIQLLGITTEADKRLDITLTDIGGKGLFVKELEEALLAGRADMAVHSMKDVPMTLPPGLCVPVVGEREDPRDVFVSNRYASLLDLPPSATIGTSSLRRQTQLLAIRPDVVLKNLRGNIHTRLARLDNDEFDAIILAGAGLIRMHMPQRIRSYLSIDQLLPAAGQGALGIECREDDLQTQGLIAPLDHQMTHDCVRAERALCRRLGGGCKVPIAAFAHLHHHQLTLQGLVANRNGSRLLYASKQGHPETAEKMGIDVADELLRQGAENILREFND